MVTDASSPALAKLAAQAKILVVGAGGIGCELLKNLVLSGFTHIEVVDLDVIELSNLNRQFLFRRHHIGQSKALVAAQAVLAMHNPDDPKLALSIVPHFANIKDTNRFPIQFFKKFTLILNALDNLDARRHVNQMALLTNTPLVESGTAGYFGQTSVIIPRRTECFDCLPKEMPKTFPVCTIRSTPSTPLHCIVWAKDYLLSQLFGEFSSEESEQFPKETDPKLLDSLINETKEFSHLRDMIFSHADALEEACFDKIFNKDIQVLRSMDELWTLRPPPTPIPWNLAATATLLSAANSSEVSPSVDLDHNRLDEHQVWSLQENIGLFRSSLNRLVRRVCKANIPANTCSPPTIWFDKDDQDTLDFVAASANIRAHIFGIPMQSRWSIKSIAGNIIPAIATTNAIAAGMIVLQAFNILKGQRMDCSTAFITYGSKRRELFVRAKLCLPNQECPVCHCHRALLYTSVCRLKLRTIIDDVIKDLSRQADFAYPAAKDPADGISIFEGARLLYDEDMDQGEMILEKPLDQLQIRNGTIIKLDFIDGPPLVLGVIDDDSYEAEEYQVEFDLIPPTQLAQLGKRKEESSNHDAGASGNVSDNANHKVDGQAPTIASNPKMLKQDKDGAFIIDEQDNSVQQDQESVIL